MVGATGANAGLVLPELTKRGVAVRALVRDRRRAQSARRRGAGVTAIGDLSDPASVRAAVAGSTASSTSTPRSRLAKGEMGVAKVRAAQGANLTGHSDRPIFPPLKDQGWGRVINFGFGL